MKKGVESFAQYAASEESYQARKEREQEEALERAKELAAVADEAEGILYKERRAETFATETIGRVELAQQGYDGAAEAYAQQNKPEAEWVMRVLSQVQGAEKTIRGSYFDAQVRAPKVADYIEKKYPWVVGYGNEAAGGEEYSEAA